MHTYYKFGPRGSEFQGFHELTWEAVSLLWNTNRPQYGLPPLEEALRAYSRTAFWFDRVMTLAGGYGIFTLEQIMPFWNTFGQIFSPELSKFDDIVMDEEAMNLREQLFSTVIEARHLRPVNTCVQRLSLVSYGSFSQEELTYLLQDRLLEIGAGAGYFAWVFRRLGGDIIALDNNKYDHTHSQQAQWTRELLEDRHLLLGDSERITEFAAGRTLLMSWPEPGALYPAEALKAFYLAGGTKFVIKLGGFIGQRTTTQAGYVPPERTGENVLQFLQLLSRDWVEVKDPQRPEYDPLAMMNNCWVFQRK